MTMITQEQRLPAIITIVVLCAIISLIVVGQAHRRSKALLAKEQVDMEMFEQALHPLGPPEISPESWSNILRDHGNPSAMLDYVYGLKNIDLNLDKPGVPPHFDLGSSDRRDMGMTDLSRSVDRAGNIDIDANKVMQVFDKVGWHEFPVPQDRKVELLVVGGGGAGGRAASNSFGQGGGGGGGVVYIPSYIIPKEMGDTVQVVVGDGGMVNSSDLGGPGENGQDSSFGDVIALGGGGGGYFRLISRTTQVMQKGRKGGSGGGNATATTTGEFGTKKGVGKSEQAMTTHGGHGHDGGKDVLWGGGAGGGGAGSPGRIPQEAGQGGDGGGGWLMSSLHIPPAFYGGGGGGGAQWDARAGRGGTGGGGGASEHEVDPDTNELVTIKPAERGGKNTGGGGGAMKNIDPPTGTGGSGVVIVRFNAYQRRTSAGDMMFSVDGIQDALKTSSHLTSPIPWPLPEDMQFERQVPTSRYAKLTPNGVSDTDLKALLRATPFKHALYIYETHPGIKYAFNIPRAGEFKIELYTVPLKGGEAFFRLRFTEGTGEKVSPLDGVWQVPHEAGWHEVKTLQLKAGESELWLSHTDSTGESAAAVAAIRITSQFQRMYQDVEWTGGNLGTRKEAQSLQECIGMCMDDDKCAGVSYDPEHAICQLKQNMYPSNSKKRKNNVMWIRRDILRALNNGTQSVSI